MKRSAWLVDADVPIEQVEYERIIKGIFDSREYEAMARRLHSRMRAALILDMAVTGALIVMGTPLWISFVVGMGVGFVCAWLVKLAFRPFLAQAFRKELRKLGWDVCIGCGYWLRGLPQEKIRCPECGSTV